MQNDGLLKHLAIGFALALGIYVISYWGIEHRRYEEGPWKVTFEKGTNAVPVMVVNQPELHIENVRLQFVGCTVSNTVTLPQQVEFVQPHQWPFPVGFGEIIFEDLTFLPGTVTMICYGNEIELLPRVMTINRQEHAWKSGELISLTLTNPPPPIERKPKKKE